MEDQQNKPAVTPGKKKSTQRSRGQFTNNQLRDQLKKLNLAGQLPNNVKIEEQKTTPKEPDQGTEGGGTPP